MIDVHAHVLPGVDDGSLNLDQTLCLLKKLKDEGVTDVICTPHLRGKYRAERSEIEQAFIDTKKLISDNGLDIKIHLGREVYASKHYRENIKNFLATYPSNKHVLVEFDFNKECEIAEVVYELARLGYVPVLAHPERYRYLSVDDVLEIRLMGALVQINAQSITKPLTREWVFVNKLFKENLVDFVASDIHYGRKCHYLKARKIVEKKYGKTVAEDVFCNNAKKLIEG